MHYRCRGCGHIWDKGFAIKGYLHCPRCGDVMTLVLRGRRETPPNTQKRSPTPPQLQSI